MSDHSFNPFIAKKYGVTEAILVNNFVFWTRTNASKPIGENNFYDNRFWCFGTPEYFAKFFIYLSPRQIKYAIKKLTNDGAIIKGNYNKKGYDQTNWYSLSDLLLIELNLDKTCLQPAPSLIGQNCPMENTKNESSSIHAQLESPAMDMPTTRSQPHWTKLSDPLDKIVRPIPDTKPDTKQDPKISHTQEFFLEQNLYTDSEQQRKAIVMRKLCLEDEKAKQKHEDLKTDKSFTEVLDECISHYATQQKPQLVSPQRLQSWIGRESRFQKQQEFNKPKTNYKSQDERAANEQKIREREYQAQQDKRQEIEDSKKLKSIMSQAAQRTPGRPQGLNNLMQYMGLAR